MGNFITDIAAKPHLLALVILSFAALFIGPMLYLRRISEAMRRAQAAAGRAASGESRVDGVPADVRVEETSGNSRRYGYSAYLNYPVANPNKVWFVMHRAGWFNRPLAALPPAVKEVPAGISAAGFTLRFSPPEMYPLYAGKLDGAEAFLHEHVMRLCLRGGKLEIELQRPDAWSDQHLAKLARAGASLAKAFMQ